MAVKVEEGLTTLRRDFSAPVLDVYGKPLGASSASDALLRAVTRFMREAPSEATGLLSKILEDEGQKTLTLGVAVAEALAGAYDEERGMGFEERERRFALARRVVAGGVQEITPAERDKIRSLLVKRFTGSVIAPSCGELLEKEPG